MGSPISPFSQTVPYYLKIGITSQYQGSPIGSVTTTGSATSGSATLTVLSATGIAVGQHVSGTGITPGTIVAVVSGTTITLSAVTTGVPGNTLVTFTLTTAQISILGPLAGSGMVIAAAVDSGGTGYVVGDIVTAVQSNGGTGLLLQVYSVSGGVVTGLIAAPGYNAGNNYIPGTGFSTTGGSGTGLTGNIYTVGSLIFNGPAPNMLAWLNNNLQLGADIAACLTQLLTAYQLSTAVGAQLDVIGVIVGQSRTVSFQPTGIATVVENSGGGSYIVNDVVTIVQGGAVGGQAKVTSVSAGAVTGLLVTAPGNGYSVATGLATTGGSGTGLTVNITSTLSPVLDDGTYRTLLQCRVAQNHWTGQIDDLQAFWQVAFPGGQISIQDNQNMTATVYLSGSFTSLIEDLITNGLVVPRPSGVLYTFVIATLPMFGFDLSNSYIAGFDVGHFT